MLYFIALYSLPYESMAFALPTPCVPAPSWLRQARGVRLPSVRPLGGVCRGARAFARLGRVSLVCSSLLYVACVLVACVRCQVCVCVCVCPPAFLSI